MKCGSTLFRSEDTIVTSVGTWRDVSRCGIVSALLLSTLRGDRVVYQSLLWRGAAEAHAVVSRIARNSARRAGQVAG
eukprot:312759-Prymnesium_polylepis.1